MLHHNLRENPHLTQEIITSFDDYEENNEKGAIEENEMLESLGHSLLVIDDSNLTLGWALSDIFPEKKVTSAMKEKREDFIRASTPRQASILRTIEDGLERPNLKVQFEVRPDVINQQKFSRLSFSDILWIFPGHQSAKKNKKTSSVKRGQELLRSVFKSLSHWQMSKWTTRLHVVLLPEQSGFDQNKVKNKVYFGPEPPLFDRAQSWIPLQIAAESGLRAILVEQFNECIASELSAHGWDFFESDIFTSKNRMAHTISFELGYHGIWEGRQTFVPLDQARSWEMSSHGRGSTIQELSIRTISNIYWCHFHHWRPAFEFILVVAYTPIEPLTSVDEWETIFLTIVRDVAGPLIVCISLHNEVKISATTKRRYRIYWQGWALPLSQSMAVRFHSDLCSRVHSILCREDYESDVKIEGWEDPKYDSDDESENNNEKDGIEQTKKITHKRKRYHQKWGLPNNDKEIAPPAPFKIDDKKEE